MCLTWEIDDVETKAARPPEFGAQEALEALQGEEPVLEQTSLFSNTPDADFCVAALNEAISRFGPPDITNSNQGAS
ncbi:hypothetical protein SAMN05519105_1118 [Rhodobacter sp. 24-YEA-8]|nr:hypothetical protein SAMN05519105_1118 [Rhodobacter sp. 24-YEA-8]